MRILLAEDDFSLGSTLREWLQLDGHAVDWVQRGDLAQVALRTQDYQCILLDRGLPGLEGDALLRELRQARSTVPVLMITARDALEDRVQGLDMGCLLYTSPSPRDKRQSRMPSSA